MTEPTFGLEDAETLLKSAMRQLIPRPARDQFIERMEVETAESGRPVTEITFAPSWEQIEAELQAASRQGRASFVSLFAFSANRHPGRIHIIVSTRGWLLMWIGLKSHSRALFPLDLCSREEWVSIVDPWDVGDYPGHQVCLAPQPVFEVIRHFVLTGELSPAVDWIASTVDS